MSGNKFLYRAFGLVSIFGLAGCDRMFEGATEVYYTNNEIGGKSEYVLLNYEPFHMNHMNVSLKYLSPDEKPECEGHLDISKGCENINYLLSEAHEKFLGEFKGSTDLLSYSYHYTVGQIAKASSERIGSNLKYTEAEQALVNRYYNVSNVYKAVLLQGKLQEMDVDTGYQQMVPNDNSFTYPKLSQ